MLLFLINELRTEFYQVTLSSHLKPNCSNISASNLQSSKWKSVHMIGVVFIKLLFNYFNKNNNNNKIQIKSQHKVHLMKALDFSIYRMSKK